MKFFNDTKKTRFKMATYAALFLAGIITYAIYKETESVATSAITAFMTIIMVYIGGDSYRKSNKDNNEK